MDSNDDGVVALDYSARIVLQNSIQNMDSIWTKWTVYKTATALIGALTKMRNDLRSPTMSKK